MSKISEQQIQTLWTEITDALCYKMILPKIPIGYDDRPVYSGRCVEWLFEKILKEIDKDRAKQPSSVAWVLPLKIYKIETRVNIVLTYMWWTD